MAYLTPGARGNVVTRLIAIPEGYLPAISGALLELACPHNWEVFGAVSRDDAADDCEEAWLNMTSLVGMVLPYANDNVPDYLLPCDGSVYQRADYPNLYAVLSSVFQIDEDTFKTPDLEGRTVVGRANSIGAQGGAETVSLTVDEMPSHNHEDAGHAHTEIIAIDSVINGGLEAPAIAAYASASSTGIGYASIGTAGQGDAHENMPPYLTLHYGIVCR